MKMAYTASSGEHVEIVSLLVPLSLKRKLIGVRPESLIVATCASREQGARKLVVVSAPTALHPGNDAGEF
jgi:hypothetical protein